MVTSRQTSSWLTKAWEFFFMSFGGKGRNAPTASALAQSTQFRGTTARIAGDFLRRWGDGFAGQRVGPFHAQILRRVIRRALRLAAHTTKELFHRPILERVEADHAKDAACRSRGGRRQFLKGCGKRPLDRAEF